jgi:hypothetical protein
MSQGCTASYCSQGFIALNNACQARACLWERAASAGLQRGQVLMAYMPCWMGLHAVPNTVSLCTKISFNAQIICHSMRQISTSTKIEAYRMLSLRTV